MSVLHSVLGRLGIEPAERSLFGWAALTLALMGAAAFALLNASETLFLKRVGVAYLPWALLASSALLVATTGLAGRGLASADRPSWLPRVLLILAALLLPFWALLSIWHVPALFGALVLVARQVLAVGLLVFYLALGDLVTGRQAKRLFAPLGAGVTLGGITGSFGSDLVARLIGVEGLLLVCSGLLVGAAAASSRLRAARPRRLERGLGPARGGRAAAPAANAGVARGGLWRESTTFRLLAVSLLCGGLLSPVLYFEFSYLADAATQGPEGEQALLALFAQFRGWLNVAMLGAQLWLSTRLYRSIGLPLSLALWPASYFLGFGWLALSLGLPAGVTALGAGRITEDGIGGSALRVLFNLFPEEQRSRAAGLLEGPVARTGGVLGNSLVLLALAFDLGGVIAYGALPVASLWLLAALALWRAYPSLLLRASAERSLVGVGADRETLLDPRTVRALGPYLLDADPAVCRTALELVADADPAVGVPVLAEALDGASEATRPLLVDALHRTVEAREPGALRNAASSEALARVLGQPGALGAEERADLLQVYARLTGGDGAPEAEARASRGILRRALGDREAAVRLAAIAELQRRGEPPPGVADLDAVLREALSGRDVLLRRSARKELRAMLLSTLPDADWQERLRALAARLSQRADRAETAEALVEVARHHRAATGACADEVVSRLEDGDPRVRAAALRFAGHAGLAEQAQRLVAALGARREEEGLAAREALVSLGSEAVAPLLAHYEMGAPGPRDAALSVLRELEIDPATLEKLYQRQLENVRNAVVARAALEGDRASLVLRRLEERVSEGAAMLLSLLAVVHDDERISELERRLRRAPDQRRRDILIEALEALLPADARAELVPLLEAGPWPERGRHAASQLGRRLPAAAAAWQELRQDPDALTRRLVAALRPMEGGAPIGDPSAMEPVEIAVRLQAVAPFDRLTTQQLMRLAVSLEERLYEMGQPVFAEGDEGDGLYVVLEGGIELKKGEQRIDERNPGSFFGELATLDGVPRSDSAHAREPTRLLRLGREDLLTLMEEVPALGIALSQFLSLRVRALEDRLGPQPGPDGGER